VRRFQGRVYGVAITLLGDPGLAEDVAQEAFVRAWKHVADYGPDSGSVSTWLLRITRNLAFDDFRRRRSQPS
jgi:RNA polymerase sigma factor (sigma-70 family)